MINWFIYSIFLTSCNINLNKNIHDIFQNFQNQNRNFVIENENDDKWLLKNLSEFNYNEFSKLENNNKLFEIYIHEYNLLFNFFKQRLQKHLLEQDKDFIFFNDLYKKLNKLKIEYFNNNFRKPICIFNLNINSIIENINLSCNVNALEINRNGVNIHLMFPKIKVSLLEFNKIIFVYSFFLINKININKIHVYFIDDNFINNNLETSFCEVINYDKANKTSKKSNDLLKNKNKKIFYSNNEEWYEYIKEEIKNKHFENFKQNIITIDFKLKNQINNNTNNVNYVFDKNICQGKISNCMFMKQCRNKYWIQNNPLFKYSFEIWKRKGFNKNELNNKKSKKLKDFEMSIKENYKYLLNKKIYINKNNFYNYCNKIKCFQKKKQLIFFDFETFSIPFWFNNNKCYLQNPFQVSIIKINNLNDRKYKIINLINQPSRISLNFLKSIVDNIFAPESLFFVYYQGLEKTVLLNIKKLLLNSKYLSKSDKNKYEYKINYIISNKNLIDLIKFFSTKDLLGIPKLLGYTSIKYVNNYLQNNFKHICKKANLVSYSDLEVSNGLEATLFAKQELYNLGNIRKNWNQISKNLKKYCENDVRSMIAIFYWLQDIYNKKNSQISIK